MVQAGNDLFCRFKVIDGNYDQLRLTHVQTPEEIGFSRVPVESPALCITFPFDQACIEIDGDVFNTAQFQYLPNLSPNAPKTEYHNWP